MPSLLTLKLGSWHFKLRLSWSYVRLFCKSRNFIIRAANYWYCFPHVTLLSWVMPTTWHLNIKGEHYNISTFKYFFYHVPVNRRHLLCQCSCHNQQSFKFLKGLKMKDSSGWGPAGLHLVMNVSIPDHWPVTSPACISPPPDYMWQQ